MAYSINPNLPKARATALRLLFLEAVPLQTVARKCGVHRSTVYRWKLKWLALNANRQLENYNRPSRKPGRRFRLECCRWIIPTGSSRPHSSPSAIAGTVVARILELRRTLKRCAKVVWYYLTHDDGIHISLSSVRRILKRTGYANGRKKRVRPGNPRRPHASRPGELVETDTIHHVDPGSGRRLYYYTVIDLYSRLAYVELSDRIGPRIAAGVILRASARLGFTFAMVQSDNGPEFSRYFEERLHAQGISTRHSRLHRPNDNAHIERFNRTVQTECIGYFWRKSVPLSHQRDTLAVYLDYYNTQRVHLGIQMQVPAAMLQRS